MSLEQQFKVGIFTAAKWIGLRRLGRFLMRRKLAILGYHGFQYSDEAHFRPILFMDPYRFAGRSKD